MQQYYEYKNLLLWIPHEGAIEYGKIKMNFVMQDYPIAARWLETHKWASKSA